MQALITPVRLVPATRLVEVAMPIYDRHSIPDSVGRGVLDSELQAWLPKGPVLGADEPVATQRASHAVLGQKPWPDVGSVEQLVLDGPHGSLGVRVHIPSRASGGLLRWGNRPRGALVYLHGGGWTVGTLDEFEVPMRLLAERAGISTYAVEYKLSPEVKWPSALDEGEFVVRWLIDHAAEQGVDPKKVLT